MININDVAKKAGVSKGTVSRFLNDKPYVKKETRESIIKAIKELNYFPSNIAVSLKKKRTHMVGLIVEDIANPVAAEFSKIIADYLNDIGYKLILMNRRLNETIDTYIDSLLESRVDGIISTTTNISIGHLKLLNKINFPFVFLGSALSNSGLSLVINDDYKGAYLITEYLINLGHTKIAHITGGQVGGEVTVNRHNGYLNALKKYNIKMESKYVLEGDYTTYGGFNATSRFIALKERPTAIFCANDYAAYGAIDAILNNGLKVPEDISVAGYDNIIISSNKLINLTTIELPKFEMAKKAVEILILKINNKDNGEVFRSVYDPKLILRKSTKKIIN